jgi:hypothetical protein
VYEKEVLHVDLFQIWRERVDGAKRQRRAYELVRIDTIAARGPIPFWRIAPSYPMDSVGAQPKSALLIWSMFAMSGRPDANRDLEPSPALLQCSE